MSKYLQPLAVWVAGRGHEESLPAGLLSLFQLDVTVLYILGGKQHMFPHKFKLFSQLFLITSTWFPQKCRSDSRFPIRSRSETSKICI